METRVVIIVVIVIVVIIVVIVIVVIVVTVVTVVIVVIVIVIVIVKNEKKCSHFSICACHSANLGLTGSDKDTRLGLSS